MIDDAERDAKLMKLFGELAAAVVERGLAHARSEDVHVFGRCNALMRDGTATAQVRIDFHPEECRTSVWLIDRAGEAVVQVCGIVGRTVKNAR